MFKLKPIIEEIPATKVIKVSIPYTRFCVWITGKSANVFGLSLIFPGKLVTSK